MYTCSLCGGCNVQGRAEKREIKVKDDSDVLKFIPRGFKLGK